MLKALIFLSGVPKGIRTPVAGVKGLRYHPKNAEASGFSLQGTQEKASNT